MRQNIQPPENPHDVDSVLSYITKIASRSEHRNLSEILELQVVLAPRLRIAGRSTASHFEIKTAAQKIAAVTHVRGQLAHLPCSNCIAGHGPFRDCVQLVGFDLITKAACTNCQWNLNTTKKRAPHGICDFAAGKRPQNQPTKRRKAVHLPPPSLSSKQTTTTADKNGHLTTSIHSKAGTIHILGRLHLPKLGTTEPEIELLSLFNSIASDIRALEERDMKTIKKSILDLSADFDKFKNDEQQAWIESGNESKDSKFLVSPSGSLTSPISHHLNQPSFTTNTPNDGMTLDLTNGCIAMVAGTAFENNTLIYDELHRRSTDCEDLDKFPQQVLNVHQELTRKIMESSEAKVELEYGSKVQNAILNAGYQMTPLPLWGPYAGIILLFAHEASFRNAQPGYKFRKIMVFAYHPQRLFYDRPGGPFVTWQEAAVTVAAALAKVDFRPGYYRHKLWIKEGCSSHLRHAITITGENSARLSDHDQHMESKSSELQQHEVSWDETMKRHPHSNKELSNLLPAAIWEIETDLCSEWNHPTEFPNKVQNWWQGQKQILFYDIKVRGIDEILYALDRCRRHSDTELPQQTHHHLAPMRNSLAQLMRIQKAYFDGGKGKLDSTWASHFHSRFDNNVVPLVCIGCKTGEYQEEDPVFAVHRPYFVCMREMLCQNCGTKTRKSWIPKDKSLQWIKRTGLDIKKELKWEPRKRYEMLLRTDILSTETVASFCIRCKEETRLSNGENSYIDTEPIWTIGGKRPLYVERRPECCSCKDQRLPSGRFVPIDPTIPSIEHHTLSRLADLYGMYDKVTKGLLLDHWPPASRGHRKKRNR